MSRPLRTSRGNDVPADDSKKTSIDVKNVSRKRRGTEECNEEEQNTPKRPLKRKGKATKHEADTNLDSDGGPVADDDKRDEDYCMATTSNQEDDAVNVEDDSDDSDYGNIGPGSSNRINKARDIAPLLNILGMDGSANSTNFGATQNTAYMSYNAAKWNPQHLYRVPSDITLNCIRKSAGNGVGRVTVGEELVMDTTCKAGNRRVSAFIVNVCNDKKDYIGQYQKMDGKIRTIRYFWKASNEPERFTQLFEEFEELSGIKCPLTMGEVIKFPNTNLNTLRISDVTLRRLNDIIRMVRDQRVVVTLHRVAKIIEEREKSIGYKFSIDKKSLIKCIKTLENLNLVKLYETEVVTDNQKHKVVILCHSDIPDGENPEVSECIQRTIDQFHREGRVFPHGQQRYSEKKRGPLPTVDDTDNFVVSVPLTFAQCDGIAITDRLKMHRQMCSKAIVGEKKSNKIDLDTSFSNEQSSEEKPPGMNVLQDTPDIGSHTLGNIVPEENIAVQPDGSRVVRMKAESIIHCGYQAKAVRLFLMHEVLFHMVYGCAAEGYSIAPTSFEKFPPNVEPENWPSARSVGELPTYRNEISQLRFVAPLPKYNDLNMGWFMLQDAVANFPLSVLSLITYISPKVPKPLLHSYLSDELKRNICIGDLPLELRIPILQDKKMYRQFEHLILVLSALGLMAVGQSPDPKRFLSPNVTLCYLAKSGSIYDTSTSARGYANVTLPLSIYDLYKYDFNYQNDIAVYWHHLRAVVQSTSLSFRNDLNTNEVNINRHKKYSIGSFPKECVTIPLSGPTDDLTVLEPADGCAGFDSALFLHLRRHWDLNTRPSNFVNWFILRFRMQADAVKQIIEPRVRDLQKDWNSFVKCLMPSDLSLTNNKKIMASRSAMYPTTRSSIAIEPKGKTRLQPGKKPLEWRKKKRPLDSVDMVSEQSKIHVRSRFNAKEKDMLILIRAVGFFLNPVYRFWLDPAVLRDIMHEYVPESRTKTVQSLMAAGVREMIRPNRLAYLQRIVRNLSTFQEMRDQRYKLATNPISTTEAKKGFFKTAFHVANRLLFMENQAMPHVASSDKVFEEYIRAGEITISTEQAASNPIPLRSRRPTALAHIHHCVAVNILVSILIHSIDEAFNEKILDQVSATVIHNALQVLRSDGLVSRTRNFDATLNVVTKNQAALSYYFRHFFAHRYHPDINLFTTIMFHYLDKHGGSDELEDLDGVVYLDTDSNAGQVISAASVFYYSGDQLEAVVPQAVLDKFQEAGSTTEPNTSQIKQIRYLEHTDLKLEEISISHISNHGRREFKTKEELAAFIDRSQPAIGEGTPNIGTYLLTIPVAERAILREYYDIVDKAGAYGAGLDDISKHVFIAHREIESTMRKLCSANQVLEVGIDKRRWVANSYADAWAVELDGRRVFPRPWTKPTGGVCVTTLYWMAESCLMTVVANPGITAADLHFRYEFALQPAAVDELICLLEEAKCVKVCEDIFESIELSSPFQDDVKEKTLHYYLPTFNCLEIFSRSFAYVTLLPSMGGKISDDDKERLTAVEQKMKDVVDVKQSIFSSNISKVNATLNDSVDNDFSTDLSLDLDNL